MIIYGEEGHPEVRGALAWTQGQGTAILDPEEEIEIPRRRFALFSQVTKSEESFAGFVARFVPDNRARINEPRIIDAACPETDERCHDGEAVARLKQRDQKLWGPARGGRHLEPSRAST